MVITQAFKRTICIFCLAFFISISYCQINFYKKVKAVDPGTIALSEGALTLLGGFFAPEILIGAAAVGGLVYANNQIEKYHVVERVKSQAFTWGVDVIAYINNLAATHPTTVKTSDLPTGLISNIAKSMQSTNLQKDISTVPQDNPTFVSNYTTAINTYNKTILEKYKTAFPGFAVSFKFSSSVMTKFMKMTDGSWERNDTGVNLGFISTCVVSLTNLSTKTTISNSFTGAMIDTTGSGSMSTFYQTTWIDAHFYNPTRVPASGWTTFKGSVSSSFGVDVGSIGFPISKDGSICFYPPIISSNVPSISIPTSTSIPVDTDWTNPYPTGGVVSIPSNPSIPTDSTSIPISDTVPSVPAVPGTDTGTYIPVLSDILNVLKDIWDWLKEILQKIYDAIMSIPGLIVSVGTAIKTLTLDWNLPNSAELDFSPLELPIADKFPFCIPFDLINMFKSFSATPKAPKFETTFPSIVGLGEQKIVIDFDKPELNRLAMITRYFMLIGFIIALILITKEIL